MRRKPRKTVDFNIFNTVIFNYHVSMHLPQYFKHLYSKLSVSQSIPTTFFGQCKSAFGLSPFAANFFSKLFSQLGFVHYLQHSVCMCSCNSRRTFPRTLAASPPAPLSTLARISARFVSYISLLSLRMCFPSTCASLEGLLCQAPQTLFLCVFFISLRFTFFTPSTPI